MERREHLDELTRRWRDRREGRRREREASGAARPPASPERVADARRAFPYREVSPAAYVAEHGAEMTGYTFDDDAYPEADLQDWLDEVGRLLRAGPMAPPR